MAYYQRYTSREARLLDLLGNRTDLPDAAKVVLDDIAASITATRSEASYRAARLKAEADARAAVLDADEFVSEGRCQASVDAGWHPYCVHPAKVRRRWTTTEFTGYVLDGKPVEYEDGEHVVEDGWTLGRGYAKRPLTEDETDRLERTYTETPHEKLLCGTHRNQKGRYGMPW